MKSIKIKTFRSSELNTEFTNIISLEIENAPFDSGAFGEVYFCNSINGKSISAPQVLKIFIDDGTGSAERGIRTIYKLQEKIISHNIELKQKKEISIENINALRALPQFSYEGELNGKRVIGYSANLLKKGEWINFGNIFNEEDLLKRKKLRTNFYNLPVEHRMKFAHDLAEGFSHLQKMNFIYADLNPQNFFVNEREAKLCLIDFEGGAVNENPETYGKPGQWLAPEIQKQLINGPNLIKVDLNTDTWAVAIGIHYMLFPFHPLSFLTSLGNREIEEYFQKYQWPEIDKNSKLFNISNSRAYDWYINKLKSQIPKELISAFSETINKGYNNPSRRLSYKQWILAITGLMKPPKITSFIVSSNEILEGNLVKLSWEVDATTHTIIINNGVGDVSSKSEIEIKPIKNSKYTLRAIGHFGAIESSIEIKVTPSPKFKELKSEHVKIKNGDSTSLIWEIENISEGRLVGLEKDPIIITKSGIQQIKPDQTTTYKFEVTALDGKTIIEKLISVEVFEEGQISFFKADRQFIFPTIPVILSWEVKNAVKVEIEGLGSFQLSGQTTVQPTVDTTYKLLVTDNFGTLTEKLQVKMLPLPVIEKLLVATPTVVSSSTINISLPNYSANKVNIPQIKEFRKAEFHINLDSNILIKTPEIKNLDYKIEEITFLKRVKNVIKMIKKEFLNEKNKKYVIKK